MSVQLKIDFISDVTCPWCVIAWISLQQAIDRLDEIVDVQVNLLPFELNPGLPHGGEDVTEYMRRKYGSSAAQTASIHQTIARRGQEVGFAFAFERRTRIYNTRNANRLLYWAKVEGTPYSQLAVKARLSAAYFKDGRDVSSIDVLVGEAALAGLTGERARAVLESDLFDVEVLQLQERYASWGLTGVPAVVFDSRHLLAGAQTVESYQRTIENLMASIQTSLKSKPNDPSSFANACAATSP